MILLSKKKIKNLSVQKKNQETRFHVFLFFKREVNEEKSGQIKQNKMEEKLKNKS